MTILIVASAGATGFSTCCSDSSLTLDAAPEAVTSPESFAYRSNVSPLQLKVNEPCKTDFAPIMTELSSQIVRRQSGAEMEIQSMPGGVDFLNNNAEPGMRFTGGNSLELPAWLLAAVGGFFGLCWTIRPRY